MTKTKYPIQSPEKQPRLHNPASDRVQIILYATAQVRQANQLRVTAEASKIDHTNMAIKNVGHISTQDTKTSSMFDTPYTLMLKDLRKDNQAKQIIDFNPHNIPHTVPELDFNIPPMDALGLAADQPVEVSNILNEPVGPSEFIADEFLSNARLAVATARNE
jgi:hypothetical protein